MGLRLQLHEYAGSIFHCHFLMDYVWNRRVMLLISQSHAIDAVTEFINPNERLAGFGSSMPADVLSRYTPTKSAG